MGQKPLWKLAVLTVWAISAIAVANAESEATGTDPQLLSGDRIVLVTVEEVRSGQARIGTGEAQPRFIPMNVRKDKGLPELKQGDLVEITVNDQNLLVDVHIPGEFNHHRVVGGELADPLETGHEMAVIWTPNGEEQSHLVRPLARSKVASIPVGADVLFLIDELDKIVDVAFGSKEAVQRAAEASQKMSPIKGNLARVVGTVLQPLKKGDAAVLFVDDDNQVTDVAFVPDGHK